MARPRREPGASRRARGPGRLRSVFDKTDRRFFQGQDIGFVLPAIQRALYESHGVTLVQSGPTQWIGKSTQASYSLSPKVVLNVDPMPNGFSIDARVAADLDGTGIAMVVLCYLFCLPAGIVLALLAHQDFAQRRDTIMQTTWYPVQHLMTAPAFGVLGLPPHR